MLFPAINLPYECLSIEKIKRKLAKEIIDNYLNNMKKIGIDYLKQIKFENKPENMLIFWNPVFYKNLVTSISSLP